MNLMKTLKNLLSRIFRKQTTSFLIDGKYRAEIAFIHKGVEYFWYPNQLELPAGRAFAALSIYEEMKMKVDAEYLDLHCRAVDKILSDPKRINIGALALIHRNLKERSELMFMPDYIYKLASVVFFTKDESTFNYDYKLNEKKIEAWKKDGLTLDFFLTTPLNQLIPFYTLPEADIQKYSAVADELNKIHRKDIMEILSNNS